MVQSNKDHNKHAKLVKPAGGMYHRIEFGFVGAPCSTIQSLCQEINERLSDFSFGFVDADHNASDDLKDSYDSIYTDKINFHRNDSKTNEYFELRQSLANHDAVLVNGNHFKSDRQIVIVNASKQESLFKKIDRLNNIQLIVLDEGIHKPFDFIVKQIDGGQVVPSFSIENIDAICTFIEEEIETNRPPIDGLVFMGGKSQRMGEDKSDIVYHDEQQYVHLAKLLSTTCQSVYLSIAARVDKKLEFPIIKDTFKGLGPFGGLLSAFRQNPNNAILTLPCDTPFIDEEVINQLVSNRNPSKLATCFHNPETNFPEPLITIWEPRAYPVLLQFISMGYSCPRKVLINSDIEELTLADSIKLFNANTMEEREWAKEQLRSLQRV